MGRTATVLTEDEKKAICDCYRRIGNLRATARAMVRGEAIIKRALEESGVEYQTKRSGYEAKLTQVAAAYRALGSCLKVGSLLGLTTQNVKDELDAQGIEWRKTKAEAQGTMRKVIREKRSLDRAKKGLER
jgi:hypothetical protein